MTILAVLLKHWRAVLAGSLLLAALGWGTWQRGAKLLAQRNEARAVAEAKAAIAERDDIRAELDAQSASIVTWQQQADGYRASLLSAWGDAAARDAARRAADRKHAAEIADLRAQLAETPEPDRCETAARWVGAQYVEFMAEVMP